MSPDDPRHGTRNGYKNGCRQECCRVPHRAAHKLFRMGRLPKLIDSTGTRRRIQALMAMGYTSLEITEACGRTSRNWAHEVCLHATTVETTANAVRAAYERMVRVEPTGPRVKRVRNDAARNGYPLPGAWYDIDDPAETPDPGYRDSFRFGHEFDEVMVERMLAGDWSLAPSSTKAEKVAVCAAWVARGQTANELERLTGWATRRYLSTARSEVA